VHRALEGGGDVARGLVLAGGEARVDGGEAGDGGGEAGVVLVVRA
jgi:hypothetical protein